MASQEARPYHIHITPDSSPIGLNRREVWRYRDLIRLYTERTFKLTYKQTVLGPLWLILNPLLTSVVYAAVFGGIIGVETDGVPKLLFYLASHALWSLFAGCLEANAGVLSGHAAVFGKVWFPRLTIAVSSMISAVIRFGIEMGLVLLIGVGYALYGRVSPHFLLWPAMIPAVLLTAVMGMGCGLIVSSVTTRYRDLNFLVRFGIRLWMYVTPVVYPLSLLGSKPLRTLMLVNPMTAPMEVFRLALFGRGEVLPGSVISSLVFTALFLWAGVAMFNRVEKNFIDTV